jgi:aminopeptidase N
MTNRLPGTALLTAILVAVLALAAASVPAASVPATPAPGKPPQVASTSGQEHPPNSPGTAGPATAGSDGAGDPYYPTDGNGGYDVTSYDVSISYDPPSRHLDGDTTVTAVALQSLSRFNLDLSGLDVTSVEVDGAAATFARAGAHELVISPAAVVRQGSTFRVRLRYGGQPGDLNERALGAGGWHVITASGAAVAAGEPHSATAWYPSNDTPRDKATFALTARVPDGWSVISNGVESTPVSAGGWTTFRWTLNSPTATYLTMVAIDRWTVVRSTLPDGTPVVDAYGPGAQGSRPAQNRLPEVLAFFSRQYGDYPFDAAGGVFLAASLGYALETQTRPVYPPGVDLGFIVHELAHQWFGDSVTVKSWADICLNECFASYAQWQWQEAMEGTDLDERYRSEVRRVDDRFWNQKLYDMGAGNEFRGVYTKGPLAIHALRRQLGDETFNSVVRSWLQRHRNGNASWPEFEAHVLQVSGQQLRPFLDAWFRGTQRPPDPYLWPGPLK